MDSAVNFANAIRQMIQHEGTLMNHRFGWFLTSESLLFAALDFFWEKGITIVLLLSGVGLVTCASMSLVLRLPV